MVSIANKCSRSVKWVNFQSAGWVSFTPALTAVIAPFIGLFGTVLGIIHAFDDIARKGNSSPAVVAAGVSEALITTAAGLFVAVTAVVFFNFFKNQTRVYREDTLWAAEQLAELLHMADTGTLAASDINRLIDGKTDGKAVAVKR